MLLQSIASALLAVSLLTLSGDAAAQSHASFDGTWVLAGGGANTQRVTVVAESGDAAFRVGDMGSGWGTTLTLARRGDRLVLEYPYFSAYDLQAPLHYEFALDGSEVVNDITIGPDATRLHTFASWHGDSLVITTRQSVPRDVAPAGVMAEVQRALVLESPDSLLLVTTRVGIAGAPTNVVRSTYARKR
jgi:hypothetical protein